MTNCKLVLPLLVGLAFFSSKTRSPDRELTVSISWLLFFVLSRIFLNCSKHRESAFIIITIGFVSKLLFAFFESISLVYQVTNSIIILSSGLVVLLRIPDTIIKQISCFAGLSILISIFQISGFTWAQMAGSAFFDKGASTIELLFQGFDVAKEGGILQTRPDGFTHANNLTSQLLLFFYAYVFFHLICFSKSIASLKVSLLLISFAAALNSGKVFVLGVVFIWIASVFVRDSRRGEVFNGVRITLVGYLLYAVNYPGLFILNFNPDLFILNGADRVLNLGDTIGTNMLNGFAEMLQSFVSYNFISADTILTQVMANEKVEAISGVAALTDRKYIILLIAIGGIILKSEGWRFRSISFPQLKSGSIIIGAALVASLFGGAFYNTIWFVFFVSFPVAPIILRYVNVEKPWRNQ